MSHPLLQRLASGDPRERAQACLDAVGDPNATLLVDALTEALGDPVREVARSASEALAQLAAEGDPVRPALLRALHGDEPLRRWRAAATLAQLDPPGPRLLPPLVEALGFEDGDERWAASRLLVATGRRCDEVLPLLIGLARGDLRPVARRMAAHCLRALAPDRPEAHRALVDASRDADVRVRRAALAGLASALDPPPEVGLRLLEALEDADGSSQRIAAVALGQIGAANPDALPDATRDALHRACAGEGPDPLLRRAAQRALERLAPDRTPPH